MTITGNTTYFLDSNVDTDTIIPAKFLKRTKVDGFEPFAFFEKVYTLNTLCDADPTTKDFVFKKKELNAECPLNFPHSQGSTFLLTWDNFGCGSSREHAVYALCNYKVIIGSAPDDVQGASAFADIFRDNCRQNLIWTPVISAADHKLLSDYLIENLPKKSISLRLDTKHKTLYLTDDKELFSCSYDIPPHHESYFATAKNPFDMARNEIEQAINAIANWEKQNQHVITTFPSTNR